LRVAATQLTAPQSYGGRGFFLPDVAEIQRGWN
jgi:hypothetical protein